MMMVGPTKVAKVLLTPVLANNPRTRVGSHSKVGNPLGWVGYFPWKGSTQPQVGPLATDSFVEDSGREGNEKDPVLR